MRKLLILLILSFFSTQGFAAGCPDGSDPVKSVSADGTYFVFECGGSSSVDNNLTAFIVDSELVIDEEDDCSLPPPQLYTK